MELDLWPVNQVSDSGPHGPLVQICHKSSLNKIVEATVPVNLIGVGRFRILGGPRFRILGGPRGGQIPSRHMTS